MKKMTQRLEAGKDINQLAEKSRRWVLVSFSAVVLLMAANPLLFPTEGARLWVIMSVQIMPLMLFVPGIWARRPRSHAWLCFVSLLYFMRGTTESFIPGRELFGIALGILSILLFSSAMMFSRWESMRIKAELEKLNPQPVEANDNQEDNKPSAEPLAADKPEEKKEA